MFSSQPLSRSNVDSFIHVDFSLTKNLEVSLTNEGALSTTVAL